MIVIVFYFIVCMFFALFLPHMTADSVPFLEQVMLQILFVVTFVAAFFTFK